ncbi:hypothetical protein ACJX0J_017999, partial [Zea mays]
GYQGTQIFMDENGNLEQMSRLQSEKSNLEADELGYGTPQWEVRGVCTFLNSDDTKGNIFVFLTEKWATQKIAHTIKWTSKLCFIDMQFGTTKELEGGPCFFFFFLEGKGW